MPLIFLLSTPPETSISFVLKKSEPVRGHLPDPLPIRELDAPPLIITPPHQNLPNYANEYNIYPSLP